MKSIVRVGIRIPPSRDPYSVLGVPRHATEREIRNAFRSLAPLVHPDKTGSAEDFTRLNEAFQIIGDVDRRAEYHCRQYADICTDESNRHFDRFVAAGQLVKTATHPDHLDILITDMIEKGDDTLKVLPLVAQRYLELATTFQEIRFITNMMRLFSLPDYHRKEAIARFNNISNEAGQESPTERAASDQQPGQTTGFEYYQPDVSRRDPATSDVWREVNSGVGVCSHLQKQYISALVRMVEFETGKLNLLSYSLNPELPEKLREAAGLKYVQLESDADKLRLFSKMSGIPEDAKEAAIDKAGFDKIESVFIFDISLNRKIFDNLNLIKIKNR